MAYSAAYSSTESCCFCNCKLESSKGKGKHKKFNGSSCVMEREVIRNCMLDLDLDLSLDQTFEGNIIICYSCCLKLKKIKKFEEDLRKLRAEIQSYLRNCHSSVTQGQQQLGIRRNRSPSDCDTTSPPAKVNRRNIPSSASCASPECEVSEQLFYIRMYIMFT